MAKEKEDTMVFEEVVERAGQRALAELKSAMPDFSGTEPVPVPAKGLPRTMI